MMNMNTIRHYGRGLRALLLTIGLLGILVLPANADNLCQDECDSYLTQEDHSIPNGDSSLCAEPIANFCACPKAGCQTLDVSFTDWSIGCIDTWEWNFGDPASGSENFSNEENPNHFYAQPGVFTVTLTVTGAGGTGSKSKSDYIVVRKYPIADFVSTSQTGCVPMTVIFEDRSIDAAVWDWNFGDGATSHDRNPVHDYMAPGIYTVTLKVINECGKDIKTKQEYITVGQNPMADFSSDVNEACEGAMVTFTDLSVRADSRLWEFGDGTTSTDQNPSHVYSAAGTYSVTLTVSNACGDDTITKEEYIAIWPAPVADFSADLIEACTGATISFTDGSQYATSWLYDFGDGNASTAQNPTHSYVAPGVYTVTLTVYNDCGSDKMEKVEYITVVNEPVADFSANMNAGCPGMAFLFSDESSNAMSWSWEFGDGTTSTDQNPTHAYMASGWYAVSLTVTNACGSDTETKERYIRVLDTPIADFSISEYNACAPATVSFTDLSTNATSWHWDFGDGATSIEQNPAHTYSIPGIYGVRLTAVNICGQDVEYKEGLITIYGEPQADFSANITTACVGQTIQFSDLSTNAATRSWDFGDGTTSTEIHPIHAYALAGTYTVSLTVSNPCGDDTETKETYIQVTTEPVASFEYEPDGHCPGTIVTFTNLSSDAYGYHWEFGDGATSIEPNPSHTYTQPGMYYVTLTATNDCGIDDFTHPEAIVIDGPPTSDFTADNTIVCVGADVHFTDLSANASSWMWGFGDGTTSTDQNPVHHYDFSEMYDVTLITTNECGSDTTIKMLYVHVISEPTVDFSALGLSECVNMPIHFTSQSQYAYTWTWDFGDSEYSNEENPAHSYQTPGTYTVSLIGANICGADTVVKEDYIIIYPITVAEFTADKTSGCSGDEITFTNLSEHADSYHWNFGDGTTSTETNPIHDYTAEGAYTVSLTAIGICGESTETKTNYITITPPPIASFTPHPNEGCEAGSIGLTNESQYGSAFHWDFGDGSTSDLASPGAHTYDAVGTYTITLIVSNACGADTVAHGVTITETPLPTADFYADIYEVCIGGSVQFSNLSTNADSYSWSFGDGATSTAEHPSHSYAAAGFYTVSLTAYNDCGNDVETKTNYIMVLVDPIADFYTYTNTSCTSDTVAFNDDTYGATTWYWEFGDGGFSQMQYPYHVYTTPGTYTVSLTVSNLCGEDTETKVEYLTINPSPVADFGTEVNSACEGGTIYFFDRSTDAETWSWDFGDGGASTDRNPSHVYAAAGTYTVSLTVTNDCGSDTATKTGYIVIYGNPVADFTADDSSVCTGTDVTFTDKSEYAATLFWDFGDGTTSTDPHAVHAYTTAGLYTVSLTVTNPCGDDTETKTQFITVNPTPIAGFNTEVPRACVEEMVYFYDNSTYADIWSWDFGDGATSSTQHPTHTYTTAGVYTVTLTVANDCGEDSETKIEYITVTAGPTADFTAQPRTGSAPLDVDFTDLSISPTGIFSWLWTFGDGATSTDENPAHTYTSTGIYLVSLTVIDECGEDTETKTEYIHISENCSVDFIAEPVEGCAPLTIDFTGMSFGPCEISSWKWNFGDPTGSSNIGDGRQTSHTYTQGGIYTVTLTAADISGDIVIAKVNYITVIGDIAAAFDAVPTNGPAPLTVTFSDRSTTEANIDTWEWNFGDPASGSDNISFLRNPIHVYGAEGVYTAMLIIANDCFTDTAYTEITVSPDIVVTKEVDKGFAPFGSDLLYTITVRNNGEGSTGPVTVIDSIPDSTSYIAGSADNGGAFDVNGNRVLWHFGGVPSGGSMEMSFRVVIDGPFARYPGTVSNVATAMIDDGGMVTAVRTFRSNRVETVVDEQTGGDMRVVKQVNASLAAPGDQLTYTITVHNDGLVRIDNVVVFDAIPDLTTYVAGSISAGGVYNAATDSLYWNLGSLNGHESRSVSFQVTVNSDIANSIQIPNSALVNSSIGSVESNMVMTAVSTVPLVVTKSTSTPSGRLGDLMRFTIKIENYSGQPLTDVQLIDTMPPGIFFIEGTTLQNGAKATDPTGSNPYTWAIGNIPISGAVTIQYSGLVSASAYPGLNENIARAIGYLGETQLISNRAVARVNVIGQTLTGSIRGRVIVDCDDDGIADTDSVPSGMDVYLDDGSHSQVNRAGMFYFSTVRAGEHVVALDERDLTGYYIPEEAQASVFAHVHESGESYIVFRVCPDYAHLNISKEASIIPMVKITKQATLHPEQTIDSLGVLVDYQIDIKSNGLADPTAIKIVDSFPDNTMLILNQKHVLEPKEDGNRLVYDVTAAQERLHQTAVYSLKDLAPGVRRFLTNKVYLEGEVAQFGGLKKLMVSEPAEVAVGPFLLAPPRDFNVTLTPALFITSKAELQPPAIPQLEAVADSIAKYADADIRVEGHTDYRPIHTKEFPSNWELGEARAKAVVDWLVTNRNIDRDRLKYESFAATRPIVTTGTTSDVLQPNRRTEVVIQAKLAGYVDQSLMSPESWISSTALALNPMKFDTLFEAVETPLEVDLDDRWEVFIVVENTSAIAADDIALTDVIPDGVEFITGTAMIDGMPADASIDGKTIKIAIAHIDPARKLDVRYRVKAIDGKTPAGGGQASIEVMTSQNTPVVQKSNDVRFK